ncbi:putative DUF1649 domain protein [Naviculisporaceae sp. PSN 640]
MEEHRYPEHRLEVLADPKTVKDVLRGILQTIFFLRYFRSIRPQVRDVLGVTICCADVPEIDTLIEQRVDTFVRQLETERNQPHAHHGAASANGSGRGQITIQFFDKDRKKAWKFMRGAAEVCWESWVVRVTVADPKTESERVKVLKATESTLKKAVDEASKLANNQKDHIPPILAAESNPFPYQIHVNAPNQKPLEPGWATRIGIY